MATTAEKRHRSDAFLQKEAGERQRSRVVKMVMFTKKTERKNCQKIANLYISVGLQPHLVQPVSKSKVDDHSWGWPEGPLFNSYYTEV